jgi:ribonuclease BN (tRNA processing enzyme)
MRLTILGGAGAWPPAGGACSGYLIEHDGFRLLVDPGFATMPRLLEILPAEAIDAVLASHGHPDHVADLNPLLRARAMNDHPPPALPTYAMPDALRPVLALDRAETLAGSFEVREFEAGESLTIGPFAIESRPLPHFVPNAGFRIAAGGLSITYTGDAGPSDDLVDLADGTDLLLAEATYVESVPADLALSLNCAAEVGRQANRARARHLVLAHLWPGTEPEASLIAASRSFRDRVDVAAGGMVLELT